MVGDDDHSWIDISLGGGVTVSVTLAGNLFGASVAGRDFLLRLLAVLDDPPIPEGGASEEQGTA